MCLMGYSHSLSKRLLCLLFLREKLDMMTKTNQIQSPISPLWFLSETSQLCFLKENSKLPTWSFLQQLYQSLNEVFLCKSQPLWPVLFLQCLTETLQKRLLFALAKGKASRVLRLDEISLCWMTLLQSPRVMSEAKSFKVGHLLPLHSCSKCINNIQWEKRGRCILILL